MKISKPLLQVSVPLLLAFSSCQVGHEVHYFKSGKNYYRVLVDECSTASKARYLSGYFDEGAVDKYFGEMSQPIESKSTKAEDVSFLKPVTDGETIKLDSNKKLVMILSTNSDAVAEQIGAFAENEQTLEAIARLAHKSTIDQSNKLAVDIADGYKRNASVIALGDQFITGTADDANVATVKSNMAVFLQFLKDKNISNPTAAEMLLKKFQK